MRFGLIGAGKIGKLRAQAVRRLHGASLVAVFDPRADSANEVAAVSGARAVTSVDELLHVPMDALIVSSPVHVHVEPCLAALRCGLHVMCEKPLTNSVESSRELVQTAASVGRVLAVGFNLRFYPAFQFIRDAMDHGRIGTVDHIRVFGGHEGLPKFTHDWEYRAPESGGGAMWDVGIHMTDLANYYLGDITEVYGMMSGRIWGIPGSEDNAIAIFRNASGITASYQATWTEWKGYRIAVEVYGDRGMVRGEYAPMKNLLITQDKPGAVRHIERHRYPGIMLREKLRSWQSTALRSFIDELRDFEALTRGERGPRIADGMAGLRAAEVAQAVRQSSATGQPIHLAPASTAE